MVTVATAPSLLAHCAYHATEDSPWGLGWTGVTATRQTRPLGWRTRAKLTFTRLGEFDGVRCLHEVDLQAPTVGPIVQQPQ